MGLSAALSLSQAGFQVDLIAPTTAPADGRTTALMVPSLEMLSRLGLGEEIAALGTPLRAMRIIDATARLVRAPTVTFHASELGEDHFGLNVRNGDLIALLEANVASSSNIKRHDAIVSDWRSADAGIVAGLPDGTEVSGQLAVAADGRNSPARAAAGITVKSRPTGQVAVVLDFAHGRDHNFISTEFHTETGPFTQVPLPGRRSSLVWVVRQEEATRLVDLPSEELARLIETRMQSMLGRVEVDRKPQSFPLVESLPSSFAAHRTALVGEAAHVFPPIGAQGLNLGLRDVSELTAVAMRHEVDPGSEAALADYRRSRRPDIMSRSIAVNMLNRSLLSEMLPAQLARSLGLEALRRAAPLRALVMREGLKTGSGLASLIPSPLKRIGG